jgi:hypothetical protein
MEPIVSRYHFLIANANIRGTSESPQCRATKKSGLADLF